SRDGAEVRPTCELVSDGQRVRGAGCQRQDALFFGSVARPRNDVTSTGIVSREAVPGAPRFLAPGEFHPEQWAEAIKSFPALVRKDEPAEDSIGGLGVGLPIVLIVTGR